jgi:hypothetical protein
MNSIHFESLEHVCVTKLGDVLLKGEQGEGTAVNRTKLHFGALISHPYLYLMTSKQLIPCTVCNRFMYQL